MVSYCGNKLRLLQETRFNPQFVLLYIYFYKMTAFVFVFEGCYLDED